MYQFFVILMGTALLGSCGQRSPEQKELAPRTEVQPTQSVPVFSGEQAYRYLCQQTDFGPRNPNSPGHSACLRFLALTLGAAADEIRLQEFTHEGYDRESLPLTNVVAAFLPSMKERILLCAHWDTRPRADQDENRKRRNEPILGANDGASGVAVLLEIARMLKVARPSIGVDIVLFDGEDYGREGDHERYLLGSRYFAKTKEASYNPRFGILLDMIGDKFL